MLHGTSIDLQTSAIRYKQTAYRSARMALARD